MSAATALAAAAGVPVLWQVLGPMLVALVGVTGGIYAARTTLRASTATNDTSRTRADHDRDKAQDDRADATNAKLWARLDETEERLAVVRARYDEMAERHQRLRLGVIAHGLDPDEVIVDRQRKADS